MLKELYKSGMEIRLLDARIDNLMTKEKRQLSLFSKVADEKQEILDKTIDKLKEKYGYDLITRAGKMNVDKIVKINRK